MPGDLSLTYFKEISFPGLAQVKEAYREEKMGPQEFGRALELALQGNSDGVVLYKWEDLAADSVKLEILKSTLSKAGLRS